MAPKGNPEGKVIIIDTNPKNRLKTINKHEIWRKFLKIGQGFMSHL